MIYKHLVYVSRGQRWLVAQAFWKRRLVARSAPFLFRDATAIFQAEADLATRVATAGPFKPDLLQKRAEIGIDPELNEKCRAFLASRPLRPVSGK